MGRLTSLPSAVITDDIALGGAVIEKSLRFNDGDNAYLETTFGSASNRRTFTFSCWAKRSNLGAHSPFFSGTSGNNFFKFQFRNDNRIEINSYEGSDSIQVITTSKFRDTTSWYHVVVACDTTQADSSNRVKIYINGTEETAFDTNTRPSQNHETAVNLAGAHRVGGRPGSSNYYDGYLAEVHFIDGQQLTPSSFGYTEFQTGIWRPKGYFGSYGANGFRLDFSDNSAASAATLGKDRSGQGNDFTPNNISVSAGTGNDSLIDVPTNTFCTLNSLTKDSNTTLSDGNLQAAGSAGDQYNTNTQGTFAESSGKWYYEVEFTSGGGVTAVGWCRTTLRNTDNPTTGGGILYRPANGDYLDLAGNNPSSKPTTSTGQIVQVAIDFDAGKIWFGTAGTYHNSGNPSAGTNAAMTFTGGAELLTPCVRTLGSTLKFNFGQRAFSYAVPTGFKSLCSNNVPINTPPIIRPQEHFGVITYSGNGSSPRRISGLQFAPDFVWLKNRNSTNWHRWQDSVNGANNTLYSNSSNAQAPNESNGHLDAFTEDGFIVDDASGAAVNGSSNTFVAWCWKGGGAPTTTNSASVGSVPTAGSVKIDGANATSALAGTIYPNKMSVNTTAGFSISQYTATGSNSMTLAHGLTKRPDATIVKDTGTGADWIVYTKVFDGSNDYIILNSNSQSGNSGLSGVTDTLFEWGGGSGYSNTNGRTYIMYNWTSIPGYSKIGRYSAGGGTDNAYVHTGFRPAFILLRPTSNFGGSDQNYSTWGLWDSTRSTSNVVTYAGMLTANMNSPEQVRGNGANNGALDAFDILSDGFKIRGSSYEVGYNGTYFFMAFAEQPGNTPFDTETNAR